MWKATLKGLLAHKLRLALTAVAIVLGVMFVSGTFVLTDTLHSTFTTLFNGIYQNVSFEVRGKAAFSGPAGTAVRNPISATLAAKVRAVPGVEDAEGTVQGYAQLIAPDGKVVNTGGAPTIGLSFDPVTQMSALHIRSGAPPTTAHEVAIDAATATKYHFHVGERVRVLLTGPPQTFTVSGIVTFGTANNLAGATIAAFDLPTAQKIFDRAGQYDTIDVLAQPGANTAQIQKAIARILPPKVEVVTGQTVANEATSSINQALGFFSTALLVFAFISLFVGGFTIFNTFSIIVGQRTRELALLRILGASRRQVFRSVLTEAFIVGLVSSLIGLALGVAAAAGLEALLDSFGITLPTGGLVFEPRTVIVGLIVGDRGHRGLGHQPGPPGRPHPAGGRPLRSRSRRGRILPSSHRGGHGSGRPGHHRPDRRSHHPGHPTGRPGCGRRLHRHRHARPPGGPAPVERHRPPPGPPARHLRQTRPRELDAQSPPHGPDGSGSHGGPGPRLHHRRLRRLGLALGHLQRRPGRLGQLHRHQFERRRRHGRVLGGHGRGGGPRPRGERRLGRLHGGVQVPGIARRT